MSTINNTDVFLIGRSTTNYQVSAESLKTFLSTTGGPGDIPGGSVTLFAQAAAPTGWVQVTTPAYNNSAIRVVTSAGGDMGGTINFSAFFSSSSTYTGTYTIDSGNVAGTTMSREQLPSHGHTLNWNGSAPPINGANSGGFRPQGQGGFTGGAGSDQAHNHSLVGAVANGSTTSNFAVKYVEVIACSKN